MAHPGFPYEVGEVVSGRYLVREVLGAGPLGVVYRADDTVSIGQAVVKVIAPELLPDGMARDRFLREVVKSRSVQHRYVARLFDAFVDRDHCIVAMQYLAGTTLRRGLELRKEERKPFQRGEVQSIVSQLGVALGAIHRAGLVHGNLKPENVIIMADAVRIADLGTAVALDPVRFAEAEAAGAADRYMAPEVRAGRRGDVRADVYSLGTIAAEMLGIAEWGQMLADVPAALGEVVGRAMELRPEERFPDADAFAAALLTASEGKDTREPRAVHQVREVQRRTTLPLRPLEVSPITPDEPIGSRAEVTAEIKSPFAVVDDVDVTEVKKRPSRPAAAADEDADADADDGAGTARDAIADVDIDVQTPSPAVAGDEGADDGEALADEDLMEEEETQIRPPRAARAVPPPPPPQAVARIGPPTGNPARASSPAIVPVARLSGARPIFMPAPRSSGLPGLPPPPDQRISAGRAALGDDLEALLPPPLPRAPAPPPPETEPAHGPAEARSPASRTKKKDRSRRAIEDEPAPVAGALEVDTDPGVPFAGDDGRDPSVVLDVGALAIPSPRSRDTSRPRRSGGARPVAVPRLRPQAATARAPVALAEGETQRRPLPPVPGDAHEARVPPLLVAALIVAATGLVGGVGWKLLTAHRAERLLLARADKARFVARLRAMSAAQAGGPVIESLPSPVTVAPPIAPTSPEPGPEVPPEPRAPGAPPPKACPSGTKRIDIGHPVCVAPYEHPGGRTTPRVFVSLAEAKAACQRGGTRLCSQAEWEAACRGPRAFRYPYGNRRQTRRCNVRSIANGVRQVALTGTFGRCRTPTGLYDMSGNVSEWVAEGVVKGGSVRTPLGKGGRCTAAVRVSPTTKSEFIGFRCCSGLAE